MELILTCFDDRIKIRVSKAHWVSTPSQTWSKLLKISKELGFDVKLWKVLFCKDFDLVCKDFDVFLCFLGKKYGEKREKKKCPKKPKQFPKAQIFSSGPI